jgi:hypothetical protein
VNLVDRMYAALGRCSSEYSWLGNEIYKDKYICSISEWYFDTGRLSSKQRQLVEDILVGKMKNWYYYWCKGSYNG